MPDYPIVDIIEQQYGLHHVMGKNGNITHNKNTRIAFFCIVLALLTTSCVTSRRVNYLQDMTQGSQIELENRFEAVIAPYDQLEINVSSPDKPELATPFNSWSNNGGQRAAGNSYLVDVNGDIEMPTLGRVHVAGLTRLRLQDTLVDILKSEGLFKGIESPMAVWSSHKDEVISLPENFEILAASDLCDIESMQHLEKEIYGIQFHPEVHHTPRGEEIFKNFYEICQKYNDE